MTRVIQSGAYKSPYEVIARALEVLREQEGWLAEHKNEIHERVERAFGRFERETIAVFSFMMRSCAGLRTLDFQI